MATATTPTKKRGRKPRIPQVGEAQCSRCNKIGDSDMYTAVRTIYSTIQNPTRTKRSVTTAHLCPACLKKDELFTNRDHKTPSKIAAKMRQDAKSA